MTTTRRKSARTKWLEKVAAKRGMTLEEMRRDQRSTAMSSRHSQLGHCHDGNRKRNYEQTINHAIANSAKIAEGGLGTILPTAASLKAGDAAAKRNAAKNERAAATALANCERRTVNGEVRYYRDATHYAVMRNATARWFEVRADGDYACKS
jgi:hypothetical protein